MSTIKEVGGSAESCWHGFHIHVVVSCPAFRSTPAFGDEPAALSLARVSDMRTIPAEITTLHDFIFRSNDGHYMTGRFHNSLVGVHDMLGQMVIRKYETHVTHRACSTQHTLYTHKPPPNSLCQLHYITRRCENYLCSYFGHHWYCFTERTMKSQASDPVVCFWHVWLRSW